MEARVQTLWEAHLLREERNATRARYGSDPETISDRVKVLEGKSEKDSAEKLAVRASWDGFRLWGLYALAIVGAGLGIWHEIRP